MPRTTKNSRRAANEASSSSNVTNEEATHTKKMKEFAKKIKGKEESSITLRIGTAGNGSKTAEPKKNAAFLWRHRD